jgi:protein-S-isoprenylcysteine O-methyltransferase Ste14
LLKKVAMYISSLIILCGFTFMGIYLVYAGRILSRNGLKPMGRPTIQPVLFYTGKITLFTSWGFLLVNAVLVMSGQPSPHILYSFTPAGLVVLGSVFMILAFRDLGDALRVGLPGEETTLKTKGIYRFSRNPIYVGVDLIAVASVLFVPMIINIVCAVIGIAVHHLIIISEEKFLKDRFGEDWVGYKQKTRRYI